MVNFNDEIDEIILLNKNINYHLTQHGGSNKNKFNITKENNLHINWTVFITTIIIIYCLLKQVIYDSTKELGKMSGGNIDYSKEKSKIVDEINNSINELYNNFIYTYIIPNLHYIILYLLLFNLVILILIFIGKIITENGIYIPCFGCSKSSRYFKCMPGTGNGSISCDIHKKTLQSFKTIIDLVNKISNSILKITGVLRYIISFVKEQIITVYTTILFIIGLPAALLKKLVHLIPFIELPYSFTIDFGKWFVHSDYTGEACIFKLDENGNLTDELRDDHGTNFIFKDYFKIFKLAAEMPEPFPKLDWDLSVGGGKLNGGELNGGKDVTHVNEVLLYAYNSVNKVQETLNENDLNKAYKHYNTLKSYIQDKTIFNKIKSQVSRDKIISFIRYVQKIGRKLAEIKRKIEINKKKLTPEELAARKKQQELEEKRKEKDMVSSLENTGTTIDDSNFENEYRDKKNKETREHRKEANRINDLESKNKKNAKLHDNIQGDKDKIIKLENDIVKYKNYINDLNKTKENRVIFKNNKLSAKQITILKNSYNAIIITKEKKLKELTTKTKKKQKGWDPDYLYKIFLKIFVKIKFSPAKLLTGLINGIIWVLNKIIKYVIVIPLQYIIEAVMSLVTLVIKTIIKILRENVLNHILQPLGKLLPKLKTIPISIYRIYTLIVEIGPLNMIYYGLFDTINSIIGDIVPYIGVLIICVIIFTILIVCPYLGLIYQCSYIISYSRDLIISIISLVFNLNRILIAYSSKYFNSLSVVKNYKELIDKLVNFQELFEKIIQIINNLLDKIK